MTITQLEYVIAVAKHGSFTKASEKCNVTQPTLSMQVQNLEEELNIKIFIRGTKPIQLTEVGKKITKQGQIIVDGISMIESKLKKILSSYEVEPFDSKGDIFNPDFHEAIMSQNSKEKENIIIEEFEKGYKIKDKIIRHSKVIVSKGKKWEITMKF